MSRDEVPANVLSLYNLSGIEVYTRLGVFSQNGRVLGPSEEAQNLTVQDEG
jgi:hypothetical protein